VLERETGTNIWARKKQVLAARTRFWRGNDDFGAFRDFEPGLQMATSRLRYELRKFGE
jgi:hypothetical protein